MIRANYSRNEAGGAIVYDIFPIPAADAAVFGSGRVMLALQTVIIFLLGLIPAFVVGSLFGSFEVPAIVLIALGIPVLFVRWMRGYKAKTLGTRHKAQVSIQDDAVRIARPDGAVAVAAKDIRRMLLGNTYDRNRAPDSTLVVGRPSTGQIAGAAIRANVDQKTPQFCFSLELQHGNESSLIADGLDELTANNLLDDMGRDLRLQ